MHRSGCVYSISIIVSGTHMIDWCDLSLYNLCELYDTKNTMVGTQTLVPLNIFFIIYILCKYKEILDK